jgi:hypothetical protein
MALSGFICHDDYLQKTAKLTDEEVGRLFRALMKYHATGEENEITGREWLAFDFIREDIDRAEKAHNEKCEKNRQNRMNALDNERQRSSTDDNERQRSSTYKDKEKEKDNDKENDKDNTPSGDIVKPKKRFTPPTVEEVAAYLKEINCDIDPQYFIDYHIARDWILSNGKKVKDWKAVCRTWKRNNFNSLKPAGKVVSAQGYSQRDYEGEDEAALRRMLGTG